MLFFIIHAFIQQGCVKLIQSDILFCINSVLFIPQKILKRVKTVSNIDNKSAYYYDF